MLSIIAHDIRSLNNIGSFFRNADGAGFSKVYLTGISGMPPRKEISKTALWAENTIPWEYWEDIFELIEYLKKNDTKILGLEYNETSIDYREISGKNNSYAVIAGNEVLGLPQDVMNACDSIVHLPMRGEKSSLNVSVASGIIMYHLSSHLK